MLDQSRFLLSGHRFRQAPSGLRGVLCSRPFLEGQLRARVRALPQVRLLAAAITGLTSSADRKRITGVRIAPSRCPERTIDTDLVVDATGRGSRTPLWLAELGYQRPAEDRVEIGLGYATRTFRLRPDALGRDVLVINGGTPDNPRSGLLAALEGGRHIVTLSGILGDHPPTDRAGFAAFARSLAFPDIADALVGAEALDEGVTFRFPASVRRRYERLAEFPAAAAGDRGRGVLVQPGLRAGHDGGRVGGRGAARAAAPGGPVPDPRRWFRAIAPGRRRAVAGRRGRRPGLPGGGRARTAQLRMVNSYLPRLHAGASVDPALALAFVRVLGLLDRPESLLRPDRMLRVAAGAAADGPTPTRCRTGPPAARSRRRSPERSAP